MKKIISAVLAFAMVISLIPAAFAAAGIENFTRGKTYADGQFSDVASSAWYAESVKDAYELGLVNGNSATTFNPEGNITLAESIVLASRLSSIYNADGAEFAQGTPWYQVYVDYAVEKGIIGAEDYTDYNARATRLQFAKILGAALPDEALSAINEITAIPDVAAEESAVYRLYNAGILTGSDAQGTFNPASTIRRCEVAAIVARMADPALRKEFSLGGEQSEGESAQESTEDKELTPQAAALLRLLALTAINEPVSSALESMISANEALSKGVSTGVITDTGKIQADMKAAVASLDEAAGLCEGVEGIERIHEIIAELADIMRPYSEKELTAKNLLSFMEAYVVDIEKMESLLTELDELYAAAMKEAQRTSGATIVVSDK